MGLLITLCTQPHQKAGKILEKLSDGQGLGLVKGRTVLFCPRLHTLKTNTRDFSPRTPSPRLFWIPVAPGVEPDDLGYLTGLNNECESDRNSVCKQQDHGREGRKITETRAYDRSGNYDLFRFQFRCNTLSKKPWEVQVGGVACNAR